MSNVDFNLFFDTSSLGNDTSSQKVWYLLPPDYVWETIGVDIAKRKSKQIVFRSPDLKSESDNNDTNNIYVSYGCSFFVDKNRTGDRSGYFVVNYDDNGEYIGTVMDRSSES